MLITRGYVGEYCDVLRIPSHTCSSVVYRTRSKVWLLLGRVILWEYEWSREERERGKQRERERLRESERSEVRETEKDVFIIFQNLGYQKMHSTIWNIIYLYVLCVL